MIVFKSDKLAAFDVDETLVLWDRDYSFSPNADGIIPFVDPYYPNEGEPVLLYLKPNHDAIHLLKQLKANGYSIMVWSKGGYQWAETVVRTLELKDYVDIIMTKPDIYVDDISADKFMKHLQVGLTGNVDIKGLNLKDIK